MKYIFQDILIYWDAPVHNTVDPHWQQQWEQHKNRPTGQEKQNQQNCHHTLFHCPKLVLINLPMGCEANILHLNI